MIVATVAVAFLLLTAAFLGAFSGSPGAGPGTSVGGSGAPTFRPAQATAAAAAAPHGTWTLWAAVGLDLANATSLPLNLSSLPNCTAISYTGPIPHNLSLPSFSGNLLSGDAAVWLFEYFDRATGALMVLVVTRGVVTLAVEETGANCGGAGGTELGIPPASVVDSSVAVSAAGAVGGSAFLAAHPTGVSLDMSLFGNISIGSTYVPPSWTVAFTTCSGFLVNISQSTGAIFSVSVNATTGTVIPGSESNSTCAGTSVAIGQALSTGFGSLARGAGTGGTVASQGCDSGDYCYSVPIEAVADNVTPGDFQSSVVGLSNHTTFPAVGFAILNAARQVIVYSTHPVEIAWTPGVGNSTTLLAAGMSIVVDMGTADPSGAGWALQLLGLGPFSNSSEVIGLP